MEKNGVWFFELILNILLILTVIFVTFSAKEEQVRGGVPALMSFSSSNKELTHPKSSSQSTQEDTPISQDFAQAWGSLQVWASGLDGEVTQEELKNILNSMQDSWKNPPTAHKYLKNINQRINDGQLNQVIHEALQALVKQSQEKKTIVLDSIKHLMKNNGISPQKIQQVVSHWGTEILKLKS